jgi:hypothetical protein
MSDYTSVSTALSETANKNFFESFFGLTFKDAMICSAFQFKLFFFICFIFILMSCIMTIVNTLFADPQELKKINKCMDNCYGNGMEKFGNDDFFSDKDTINSNYSNYQTTALTAPSDSNGIATNTLFGQAYRIFQAGDTPLLNFEVYCNLFVLDGNPFSQDTVGNPFGPSVASKNVSSSYLVYLMNSNDKYLAGTLTKSGDGVYKLKINSKDSVQIKKLLSYNQISIVLKTGVDPETVLLQGKFSLM